MEIPDKIFFKIGEVSELAGVKPYVLRYWETEFSIIPHKSGSGQRLYRRKDIERILLIKRLLYQEGFTIAGARKHLARAGRPAGDDLPDEGEEAVSGPSAFSNESDLPSAEPLEDDAGDELAPIELALQADAQEQPVVQAPRDMAWISSLKDELIAIKHLISTAKADILVSN